MIHFKRILAGILITLPTVAASIIGKYFPEFGTILLIIIVCITVLYLLGTLVIEFIKDEN